MVAQRTTTQVEIDAALAEMGITPLGQFTKDGTQQLYQDAEGNGLILPASVQGYSYYSVHGIIAHAQKILNQGNVVSKHIFEAKSTNISKIKKSED